MQYILEPEVSGEIGDSTVIDTSVHPPIVSYLHFVFMGWLGDDLIECFPVYLVSEHLAGALSAANFTGIRINDFEIGISDEMLSPSVGYNLARFLLAQNTG